MRLRLGVLLACLVACGGGAGTDPKPADAAAAGPSCDFSLDKLGGNQFVRALKGDGSPGDLDLLARIQFADEGGKLKAKYTARSLSDVYNYSCTAKDKDLSCWEEEIKAADFCRALVANGKECSVEAVAQLTGAKPEAIKQKVEDTLKNIKGLSGPERSRMKEAFSAPTTPLRGVLRIKMKKDQCKLSITDLYQSMTDGQLREIENVVGTSTFEPTKKELVFENCADGRSLLTLDSLDSKATDSLESVSPGENFFVKYAGKEHAKAEAGCTYAMETYVGYERLSAAAPIEPVGGALPWNFQASFPKAGRQIVHMYRYRTCGDKPQERVGVQCQAVTVR